MAMNPLDYTLRINKSSVRICYAPPNIRNPNFQPVGDGSGFLVFFNDLTLFIIHCLLFKLTLVLRIFCHEGGLYIPSPEKPELRDQSLQLSE